MTWSETRYIYAIFTLDEKRKANGVYVGSAKDVKDRIKSHLTGQRDRFGRQDELHNIMRAGAFVFRVLAKIDYHERWQEYEWIRFFQDYTNLEVYNTLIDCHREEVKKTLYAGYKGRDGDV